VGQTECDVYLDMYRIGLDPEYGGTAQAGEHDAAYRCKISCFSKSFEIGRVWLEIGLKVRSFCRAKQEETMEFLRGGESASSW
jgi:hypothetical protein